jgi:putative redox protein
MSEAKPPVVVNLAWESGLKFTARAAAHQWVLDGSNEGGPSPVVALAAALAGCMAIDLAHILTRGRFELRALTAALTGERADSSPHRFLTIDLRFTVDTDAPDDQIARAIALSHDKYCSVWHSMRPDIAFTTSFARR